MTIDQDLQERISREPDRVEQVSLCCRTASQVSDAALGTVGFTVTERMTLEDVTSVFGNIRLGDVERLASIPGIESVSSAPDVEAF